MLFLVFTHVMRRPCWCTKQWQNVAQVLHNNRIKFLKDFFRYCSVHQCGRGEVTMKTENRRPGAFLTAIALIQSFAVAGNEYQP